VTQDVELEIIKSVVTKLDVSLEKITEVSNNISRLLAVHDERLSNLEKVNNRHEQDSRDLQFRIASISKEITSQFNEMEDRLESRLKEHAVTMRSMQASFSDKVGSVEKRIEALERWRWIVIGAAFTIGYIIEQLPNFM